MMIDIVCEQNIALGEYGALYCVNDVKLYSHRIKQEIMLNRLDIAKGMTAKQRWQYVNIIKCGTFDTETGEIVVNDPSQFEIVLKCDEVEPYEPSKN